jgi:phage I-like protein
MMKSRLELHQFDAAQELELARSCFSVELEGVPEWIHILPLGTVRPNDGRKPFVVGRQLLDRIIADRKALSVDLVVDYVHQTTQPGLDAPAAGWVRGFEIRETGLWGRVEWTERATERLRKKEYRYLSPSVYLSKGGVVMGLHSVALTNIPAISELTPVVNQQKQEEGMDKLLEKLKALFGDKTPEEYAQVVQGMVDEKNRLPKEIVEVLKLSATASIVDATRTIRELQNKDGFVSVAEFSALKEKLDRMEATGLVDEAMKAGKVSAAQKAWAEDYAATDPEGFKKFVAAAPVVVPVSGAVAGRPSGQADGALAGESLEVCSQLGLDPEKFKKEMAAAQ